MEELELVFDGLDAAGTGRLSTEEFIAGLCKCRHAASEQPRVVLDATPVLSWGDLKRSPCLVAHDGPETVPVPGSHHALPGEGSYCAKVIRQSHGVGSVGVWALPLPWPGTEGLGCLSAGQFLSSQKAARDHRQLKTTSRRVRLVLPSPVLEGVDSEERRHFAAFMDQLGTDDISEE